MIPFATGATNFIGLPGTIVAFSGKIIRDIASTTTSSTSSYQPGQGISEKKLATMGWLVCDGRPIDKDKYLELYDMLGDLYGDTEQQFNLPDYRGMFLRGIYDKTDDSDLSKASMNKRTPSEAGVGSTQKDAFQAHEHMVPLVLVPSPLKPGGPSVNTVQKVTPTSELLTINLPQTGPSDPPPPASNVKYSLLETRPSNIFVYYLIRWTSSAPANTFMPPLPF